MNNLSLQKEWPKKAIQIVIPEIVLVAVICLVRLTGSLQFLELFFFDRFLQWRPTEATDNRITIIGIDEEDIKTIGNYPVPDRDLAQLLSKLSEYKPRAIGLDLVRNLPFEPGHEELVKIFAETPNLIGTEKIFFPPIDPPPSLPQERVGFSDTFSDEDGNIRRSLLGSYRPDTEEFTFSFAFLLAKKYLEIEGFSIKNGKQDPFAIRFNDVEIPRFGRNIGGYVNANKFDSTDVQTLLNFRNNRENQPFPILSNRDIQSENFDPDWIRDRIVIIGITAPSLPDFVDTNAIAHLELPGKIYGVQFHAHAASQIISTVLDGRPMLKGWSEPGEYIWIVVWGGWIILLSLSVRSLTIKLVGIGVAIVVVSMTSFFLLILGWWIPIIPVVFLLILDAVASTGFNRYVQSLQNKIEREKDLSLERQQVIESVFERIHSGPLQTLHILLSALRNDTLSRANLIEKLEYLNDEIRNLKITLPLDLLSAEETFRLRGNAIVNLNLPLHELLEEVCRVMTNNSNFPYFATLNARILGIQPINPIQLSLEDKRRICKFLEEALCNVGKHANNVTRLTVIGNKDGNSYQLIVKDNGHNGNQNKEGEGTRIMKKNAAKLQGEFKRNILPNGTHCELKFCLEK
ncbi:MAG: CHASE2 domain-containing protein [Cyanobacteria bacterium SBLK]|nr:CHASE2 domain-containing protein [Cyanobacteria bacterium SBLK]